MSFLPFSGFKNDGKTRSSRRRGTPARKHNARLLEGAEPFTLWHNLRTRPLTFVAACVGLMILVAVKTLLVRESPVPPPGQDR